MDLTNLIVVVGNPFDGLALYGPFVDMDHAEQFCGGVDTDWWIVPATPAPDKED